MTTGVSLSSFLISFMKVMRQLRAQRKVLCRTCGAFCCCPRPWSLLSQQEKAETQVSGLGSITAYVLLYMGLTKFGKK